jgi:hypothetical protein
MAKKKTDSTSDKDLEALMSGKKLTAANRKALRELGESAIDGFMMAVGYKDLNRFIDENGWRHLELESAEGIAGITESEGELYLHVEALVMPLPSDKDLIQALMREALELNTKLPGACSLGIRGTQLVASATENMRGLHSAEEYGNLVHLVMALANTIDDGMKQKYGGTTRTRKKSTNAPAA